MCSLCRSNAKSYFVRSVVLGYACCLNGNVREEWCALEESVVEMSGFCSRSSAVEMLLDVQGNEII